MGRARAFSRPANPSQTLRDTRLPTAPASLTLGARKDAAAKLQPREVTRRLWHLGPGFLALALTQAPGLDSISQTAMFCMVVLSLALAGAALIYQKTFARSHEMSCVPAVIGYVAPVLLLMCAFPAYPELALTVLGVVAFGDGSATLFGLLLGESRLPWNSHKSWAGTVAFLAAAIPLGMLIYWLSAVPHTTIGVALACGATAAATAGVVESLPVAGNDNLRTGAAAAFGLLVAQFLFVGLS